MGVPIRLAAQVAPLQARLTAWYFARAPYCPRPAFTLQAAYALALQQNCNRSV